MVYSVQNGYQKLGKNRRHLSVFMLPKLLRKVIRFSKLNPTRMKYLTVFSIFCDLY